MLLAMTEWKWNDSCDTPKQPFSLPDNPSNPNPEKQNNNTFFGIVRENKEIC
jgi:hypothetical protein